MLTITPIGDTPDAALARARELAPYLNRLIDRGVDGSFDDALQAVMDIAADTDIETAMSVLRQAKAQAHLVLAVEDLSGQRSVMDVTNALTRFAGECLAASVRVALGLRGLSETGFFAVALGKMGAFELNYSSDIDIAGFYDPDVFDGGERSPGEMAQRVLRDVVKLMDEITADGYVFRTDLRLRPDPSSTPLAVSTEMAALYYETVGQNWERMVWIKGRHVAGDAAAAERFIAGMQPYVWRRNLDYWALGDIQAIKRMINTKVGVDAFESPAPDVKLAPGGIREIEFFVQTQQLIMGGRMPSVRKRSTLGAMAALVAEGVVEPETAATLETAYLALRNVEHRIQMLHDEQSHAVPEDVDERTRLASLCGYAELSKFDADLLATRRSVQAAYDALFAQEEQTETHALGNLVFTGVDDDPGTVATLETLGFSNASDAIETIRNWHRGHVPATRTARGRQLLTAILPVMLESMGKTGEPDEAFGWFSRFFEGLSSGVQTLSMLMSAPDLLEDLVATLALAPRLASILSRRPDLLEVLVSGQTPSPPQVTPDVSFDTAMDAWRLYHREQSFLIGHRLMHGRINARDAAQFWSDLADSTITEMAKAAHVETTRRYETEPGRWAVFAMGKLGGAEMTAGSDLDIIVIYDADDMDAQRWYTRFTQRLITALTAPTAEGELYEVDMRLRPSGGAGPVAVSLSAFDNYQRHEAWTWEHMALTRLRFVAGDPVLGEKVGNIGRMAIATRARKDKGEIAKNVTDMRQRLYAEKPGTGLWDMKTDAGGLIDIEFIVQQAMLLRGEAAMIFANTQVALRAFSAGESDADEWTQLAEAAEFLQALQQVQRLALGNRTEEDLYPSGLRDRLCRAVGIADFEALEAQLSDTKRTVHELAQKKLHLTATD